MPELFFLVRWPDGAVTEHYSPSTIIRRHFAPGETFPIAEFLARARAALTAASERVREKYGTPCARAGATLQTIETDGGKFAESGTVEILDIRP